jgi:cyclopropane fatty-acyl-phospholipid synthase-like methyltransferase
VDIAKAIDLSPASAPRDSSGSPVAYLEMVRAAGDLAAVHGIDGLEILVEYPISPEWRERLRIERFARLREPHKGKSHVVILAPPPSPPKRSSRRRRSSTATAQVAGESQLIPYPEEDPVGRKLGYEGAGIMAYQTLDQMHPPMVDSAELWADAARWPEAAREHTRAAARALGLEVGQRVLDIGCGIAGPARQLVDEFGVDVYGVANSENMLATARELNHAEARWRDGIEVEFHDCQEPYERDGFDAAWSMNMIYRVPDKVALVANAAAALAPGGRVMLEDWMFTEKATAEDRELMDLHFHGILIATVEEVERLFADHGFQLKVNHDLSEVGRTHMRDHFHDQFDSVVRPRLEADFPDPPMNGRQMADEWAEAMAAQIDMYVSRTLAYRRYVGVLR